MKFLRSIMPGYRPRLNIFLQQPNDKGYFGREAVTLHPSHLHQDSGVIIQAVFYDRCVCLDLPLFYTSNFLAIFSGVIKWALFILFLSTLNPKFLSKNIVSLLPPIRPSCKRTDTVLA